MAEYPEQTSSGTSSANIATSNLLIPVEDLVNCQSVEKQRLEFKKSWNKGPTKIQVIKTVSAFANDFYNVNGGYLVIGIAENVSRSGDADSGVAKDDSSDAVGQIELPPVGIPAKEIERTQKEILGACHSFIKPPYSPVLSPETLCGKHVLVIWAQASDNRPHKAKESEKGDYHYFIRKGPITAKANDEEVKFMLENSQKIPFDDRMARLGTGQRIHHDAIAYDLVMAFLDDINSNMERSKDRSTLEKLNLVIRHGDKVQQRSLKPVFRPKNVALLMFNHVPEFYFHGAKIEVAQMTRDNEVIISSQKTFTGPLQDQIRKCMDYIFSATRKETSARLVTYPHQALRESIVNAVYHRGYDPEYPDPIKVNIRPHCLEIISYPGPHYTLKEEEFTKGSVVPQVPARNRRIGEFLRDLNLAEARGTGVQTIFRTMEKNDNPLPTFKFNPSYFNVTLPAHPKFQAVILMKEVEELEASGNICEACEVLQKAFDKDPKIINQHLIQKLLLLVDNNHDHPLVKKYEPQIQTATKERCSLLEDLEKWLSDKERALSNITDGVELIRKLVKVDADSDDLLCVTEFVRELYKKRSLDKRRPVKKLNQAAHQLLEAYGQSLISEDGILALDFAIVKFQIYTITTDKKDIRFIRRNAAILKYLTDSRDLLQDAVNMTSEEEDPKLFAKQQEQLGYVYVHLWRVRKARKSDYEKCFQRAKLADPNIHIKRVL